MRVLGKYLRRGASFALVAYVAIVAFFWVAQRRLIYFPSHPAPEKLARDARSLQFDPWKDAAGNIIGWKSSRYGHAANRMLVFHGNTDYALLRYHFAEGFGRLDAGQLWQVYLFEYPGYGARKGEPGEQSFTKAAADAVDQMLAEDARPVYVLGESLGTGSACAVASRRAAQIQGLFLITPYPTMAAAAAYHYPWLPISLILRDRWNNIAAVREWQGRTGIMLAAEDTVIPAALGRLLYESAHEPKRLWLVPEAGHNSLNYLYEAPWWREASDFLLGTKGS